MAYTQLKGQIFKREGVSYLVLNANDWTAPKLRVKQIDSKQQIREMPAKEILSSLARNR